MGSEGNSKKIEETVGGLVWVRRRNGSWWPGRIMGLHELPESCLVSPRSGTPVKLLGREDASVDWYNLEKSRRVKAFRCGEYDECIEKAKASAASANKKYVKYARREDAILHALELEGEVEGVHESDAHDAFNSRTGCSPVKRKGSRVRKPKNISTSESEHDDVDAKEGTFEANLTKELSQSGITFEDPNHMNTTKAHCLQKTRRKTPNDSEDDGSEGTKRMRGLEDLGMGVLSKREASVHSDSKGSDELVQQDSASSEPNVCSSSLFNGSPINRGVDPGLNMKKGQAQVPPVHETSKRKSRCRPLTKVLESTTMVSVPVFCDQGASPGRSSLQGATDSKVSTLESTDSKKASISLILNNNSNCTGVSCDKETSVDVSVYTCGTAADAGHPLSDPKGNDAPAKLEFPENNVSDGLFDVPFVREEKHTQDTFKKLQSGATLGRCSSSYSMVIPVSLRNEGLDESDSTSLTLDVNKMNSTGVVKHTSKWQSKRKRNTRTKGHTRASKRMDLRGSIDMDSEPDGVFQGSFARKVEDDTFDDLQVDNSFQWSNQISDPNYMDSISYGRRNLNPTQVRKKELFLREESIPTHRSLPYRQSRFTPHFKYQDAYVVPTRPVYEKSSLVDVNLEVRASYSGRHVPLVSLMSKLNGKAIVGHPVTVEVCEDGYCDRFLMSNDYLASSSGELYEAPENLSDHSTELVQIPETSYVPVPVTQFSLKSSASPKKSSSKGKKSGILSKKTRKLSSFVAADKREQDRNPVIEKLGGPVIACVPLNIVFSRINEALNGSARSAHRKLTLGNV